jgi:hypothetical protein
MGTDPNATQCGCERSQCEDLGAVHSVTQVTWVDRIKSRRISASAFYFKSGINAYGLRRGVDSSKL